MAINQVHDENRNSAPSPTQQLSILKVVAVTDVQVLMIKRQYLEQLLDSSPRLAQQIAEVMELRKRNADHLRLSKVV
jgi:hypothetical protein